jgi:hypothetical protein
MKQNNLFLPALPTQSLKLFKNLVKSNLKLKPYRMATGTVESAVAVRVEENRETEKSVDREKVD